MMKPIRPLLLCVVIHFYYFSTGLALEHPRAVQEPVSRPVGATRDQSGDAVRIKTRIVLVDVSVRDAKSNIPIRDLSLKNFQVFDDGKQRALTYFSREGDTRRPLSLLLFIDLWSMYGRKYIKQPEAMLHLADALSQLAPEDEVAVMTTWVEEGDAPGVALPKVRMVSDFTPDRQRTISALSDMPKLVSEQEKLLQEIARNAGLSEWEIELAWSLTEIAEMIMKQNSARPQAQFVVVGLLDDLFALKHGERKKVAEMGARAGVTFYGLVYKKSLMGKLFFGTLNQVVMRPRGGSLHAAEYLAEQTGGQVMGVGQPGDLATGLKRVITDLSSRYVLGFSLSDGEQDDGRMHRLDVKVEAPGTRGKRRRLKVRARRGYYLPRLDKVSEQGVS